MGSRKLDSGLISKLRASISREVTEIVGERPEDTSGDTLYVFALYAYVDWSAPALFYAWNTERNLEAILKAEAQATPRMPDEYHKWFPSGWDGYDSLGATKVLYEVLEQAGVEEMDVADDREHVCAELARQCELQMVLGLRDADQAGAFGAAPARERITLTASDEDEGASDQWQHLLTARLLNSEAVFRRFLHELRRAYRQQDLSPADTEALIDEN